MRFKFYIYGPPATGKSTLTRLFCETTYHLNALMHTSKDIKREANIIFRAAQKGYIRNPVIVINEYHAASPSTKNYVEKEMASKDNIFGFGLVIISQHPPTEDIIESGFSICKMERH